MTPLSSHGAMTTRASFPAITGRVQPRTLACAIHRRLASLIAGRWSVQGARRVRPAPMVFRQARPFAARMQPRTQKRGTVAQAPLVNLHLQFNLTRRFFPTGTFQPVLMRAARATTGTVRAGDVHFGASVLRANYDLRTGHVQYVANHLRVVKGATAPRIGSGLVNVLEVRTLASFRKPIATRVALPARTVILQTAPANFFIGGTERRAAEGALPRAAESIVLRPLRAAQRAKTVRILSSGFPTFVVRTDGERHLTLPTVICSYPRIIGWHRTDREHGAPGVTLNLVEHVRAGSGAADAEIPHFRSSPLLEYANTEAALARTVAGALRGMAEAFRSEAKAAVPTSTAPQVDIGRLTKQVYDQLERELRIERERRGL
jgi:hypothetical protein